MSDKISEAQCRYMAAAYPTLDAEETCRFAHRHDPGTFALAEAMAMQFQHPDPSDEQIAWFLNDAAAVVDDFIPPPERWTVDTLLEEEDEDETNLIGIEFRFRVNGVEYVVRSGDKVETHPISRATWDGWAQESESAREWGGKK